MNDYEWWYQVTWLLSLQSIPSQQRDHMDLKLILNSRSTGPSLCQRPGYDQAASHQKPMASQSGVQYVQSVQLYSLVGWEDGPQTRPQIQQTSSSLSGSD